MKASGFCDLNICIPVDLFGENCVEQFISLGYKTVALNTVVEQESVDKAQKKKGQSKDLVPVPKTLSNVENTLGKGLQVLQRVTVYFSDANQLQRLCKSDNTKKYDIVAVVPSSFSALQLACACKEIDLISFDADNRPTQMNRKAYNLAVANNIYFEVPYAPAIEDSGKRKRTIQVSHEYHTYGKSKNIVLSSGANVLHRVRGPYDVANLGLLFGLSEEQAKCAMSNTSRALIRRAEGRRYGRTAMTMMITDLELAESEEESDDEPVAKRSKTASFQKTKMVLDS